MAEALGPGRGPNLARTARLAGQDAELLDALAASTLAGMLEAGGLPATGLAGLPPALRGRVLHAWAVGFGCPPAALATVHVDALEALVVDWHGQGAVALPGGIQVARRAGRLATEPGPGP